MGTRGVSKIWKERQKYKEMGEGEPGKKVKTGKNQANGRNLAIGESGGK